MPTVPGTLELALDGAVRAVLGLRRSVLNAGAGPVGPEIGGSLPGGHVHFEGKIVGEGEDAFLHIHDTHRSLWRTVEWRLMNEACRPLPAPVVDLGCGDGTFGSFLRDHIDHGIEGDADALACCDPTVYAATSQADLRESLPVPDGSVASMFSNSTLEHVLPVEKALVAAAKALRPGGEFVFTVPTIELTHAFASRWGNGFAGRLNRMFGHHNLWTWSQWEERLHSAGFDDVRMRGYFTHEAARWFAGRHLEYWQLLLRRANDWTWKRDLPEFRRLVRDSLTKTAETETTCVLVRARRSG